MSISSFWKSLLPSFGQDNVLDDISRMRGEVEDSLLPSLRQAQKAFHNHPFKSSVSLTVERALRQALRNPQGALFDMLVEVFSDQGALLDGLEQIVEGYGKDITKEALTYRRANLLRFLETFSFAITFTSRLTLRVISAEAAIAAGLGDVGDSQLSELEREYFDSKYSSWLAAITLLAGGASSNLQTLEAVPDVIIDDHNEAAIAAAEGKVTLDPMKLNFITPTWNPIYHIRLRFAEWDAAAVSRAKDERVLVELKLRDLKLKLAGQHDAHVEHQIEVVADRLKKLDFKIAKLSGTL